ncbi:helix-turn-helix transcriptional regulator [Halovivax cerinus]|uniref:Helix-turn-helix transcriptional regulator n=1 Tax=Halovivax cerinus TaxID=1487865 RepID=A0ABD5NIH0_9EURY|nr:MarR family transcriptional regulator [Halovivax cerinus]
MTGVTTDEADARLAVEAIKRADALAVLADGAVTRSELMDALGVSRTTVHRLVRDLEASEFVVDDGGTYVLTGLGRTVQQATATYRETVAASRHLEPLLTALEDCDVDLDVTAFADARVTVPHSRDPYAPVHRFSELLGDTDSLRGFDTTSIAPTYADALRDQLDDGLSIELIYEPVVLELLVDQYADLAAVAFDQESIAVHVHEAIPFGLALFDDHVGVGAYDEETGQLLVFVDSDDPDAIAWGETLFEQFRDEAIAR